MSLVHPFGAHLAQASSALYTHRIQTGGDEVALYFRRFSYMKLIIRRKRLGTAKKTAPANICEHGYPDHSLFKHWHQLLLHMSG